MTRTHQKVGAAEDQTHCLDPGGSAELVKRAVAALDGRWKLPILFRLFETPTLRFSELERRLDRVSQKMLAQHLRELERDGLVVRTDHAEPMPRVDYALTLAGEALRPVLMALRDFADGYLTAAGRETDSSVAKPGRGLLG